MPLFEVAIIEKPTKKQEEEGLATEVLVFGPSAVIAQDPQSAAVKVTLDHAAEIKCNRDRMVVLVRPFA